MQDPVSIIIPAHDEAKVIAHTLAALRPGIRDGSLEVIVICNGCNDNTARVVAEVDSAIICHSIPEASKPKALNIGDSFARYFPRIYQDADVLLPLDSVRRITQVLREGPFLAAAPTMLMDYGNSSWAVRSFYDIWQQLPYVREGMIGVGVYALAQQGRLKFDRFPDIIADDGFVRALFRPHERTSVQGAWVMVRAPRHLTGLISIKSRSRKGQWELASNFPELLKIEKRTYRKAFLPLLKPPNCLKLIVYFYVNLAARLMALRSYRCSGNSYWERDESSRNAAVEDKRGSGGSIP